MESWIEELVDFLNYRPEVLSPWFRRSLAEKGLRKETSEKKADCEPESGGAEKCLFQTRNWSVPLTSFEKDDLSTLGLHQDVQWINKDTLVQELLKQEGSASTSYYQASDFAEILERNRKKLPEVPVSAPATERNQGDFQKFPEEKPKIVDTVHHIQWGSEFDAAVEDLMNMSEDEEVLFDSNLLSSTELQDPAGSPKRDADVSDANEVDMPPCDLAGEDEEMPSTKRPRVSSPSKEDEGRDSHALKRVKPESPKHDLQIQHTDIVEGNALAVNSVECPGTSREKADAQDEIQLHSQAEAGENVAALSQGAVHPPEEGPEYF